MDLPDLKRDDIARKSIRLRISKRLAPVPPTRIESIPSPSSSTSSSSTIDSAFPSRIERQVNEINLRNTLVSPPSPFSRISKFDASPVSSQLIATTDADVPVAHSESFLKLSDIKKCSAVSLDRNNQARMDFFTNPIQRTATPLAARPPTSSQTQPSSIDMLNQLEKHINQMEIDSKANEVFASPTNEMPVKQMIKMTNRYGDHENLLNTGISNVASGTGLCFDGTDGDDDDLEPRPFQRGASQARNSTLGVSLSAAPKVGKPVGRTVSDTKNVESVVRSIRLGLKKMDDDLKTTAANRLSAAAAKAKIQQQQAAQNSQYQPSSNGSTISPLTNKKKEDTIMVADRDRLPLPHGHRPRVVAATPTTSAGTASANSQSGTAAAGASTPTKRFVDRDTLRHAITSPTTSRLKEASNVRNTQVNHNIKNTKYSWELTTRHDDCHRKTHSHTQSINIFNTPYHISSRRHHCVIIYFVNNVHSMDR